MEIVCERLCQTRWQISFKWLVLFFLEENAQFPEKKKSKLLVHLFCLAKQYKNNEKLRRITEESFNNPILAKLTVHFSDEGGVGKETLSLPSCLTARCQFDRSRLQATRGAPVLFFFNAPFENKVDQLIRQNSNLVAKEKEEERKGEGEKRKQTSVRLSASWCLLFVLKNGAPNKLP